MNRRAFTVLELTTASAVASIIVVACFGMFATLARSDQRHDALTRQTIQIEATQVVIRRAAQGVVAARTMPEKTPERPAGAAAAPTPPPQDKNLRPRERDRFILEPDARWTSQRMARGPSTWRAPTQGDVVSPQRLEVVLANVPVSGAAPTRGVFGRPGPSSREDEEPEKAGEGEPEPMRTPKGVAPKVRGAFELEPDGEGAWKLVWRTYPLDLAPDAVARTAAPLDQVTLATGIVYCRWQVYQERKRRPAFQTSVLIDMPAYVELELETTTGLAVNWMFEMGIYVGQMPDAQLTEVDSAGDGAGAPRQGNGASSRRGSERTGAAGRGTQRPRESSGEGADK